MKKGCFIVNTDYGSFVTDTSDFIGNRVYHELVWEPEMINLYKSLLQPHYTVIDIGAHLGFHTVNFAFSSEHVYAFEPQLPLYNQLRGNVFLNGLNNQITCFNVGLGEADKKSSFGSLFKHNTLNWGRGYTTELINYGGRSLEDDLGTDEIEIRTLDSFDLHPHFIKIDVEGYELKTLHGARKTIESHYPILFFETFPEIQKEVFKFIKSMGYKILTIPELKADFIAIHPKFEDYTKIKQKLNRLKSPTEYK